MTVKELCRSLALGPKRWEKRLKFVQQHLGIVETDHQACLPRCLAPQHGCHPVDRPLSCKRLV